MEIIWNSKICKGEKVYRKKLKKINSYIKLTREGTFFVMVTLYFDYKNIAYKNYS